MVNSPFCSGFMLRSEKKGVVMNNKDAKSNAPAFVVIGEPVIHIQREVYLISRISDLKCPRGCMGVNLIFDTVSNAVGEYPIFKDRDKFAKMVINGAKHRCNPLLGWLPGDMPYEIYPLTNEDVEFLRPLVVAIERFYSRA